MPKKTPLDFNRHLWRLYYRPARPDPWDPAPRGSGNLPWNDPDFSERMLSQPLDQTHGAASRPGPEREYQINWAWQNLALSPFSRVLDVTCGPGLYSVELGRQGCYVTGIDFSPASIAYARTLAEEAGVADRCRFIEQDVRLMSPEMGVFDAALLIYGQLAVFTREEAQNLLEKINTALRPGGRLLLELLNPDRIHKEYRSWWYTGDSGLWGSAPYLCLGETIWYESEAISLDRYYLLHLETGRMEEIAIADQSYATEEMKKMLLASGFKKVDVYPDSAGMPLKDAAEWILYVAKK